MDLHIHVAILFRIALSTWQGILQLPCFYFLIAFSELHMTAQEAFPFTLKLQIQMQLYLQNCPPPQKKKCQALVIAYKCLDQVWSKIFVICIW